MLSTALGARGTEVGKIDTVPDLMELTTQQGDRLKAAKQRNK